jgi:outer membrane protein OmpA-like peptidoglycan-associated protein
MTKDNVAIKQFEQPLRINLGKLDSQAAIAYSSDDLAWNKIGKLVGDQLPAGRSEGYYIDENGDVIILTLHLTSFGTKIQSAKLEITTKEVTLTVGEAFTLDVSGIQGSGHVWFESNTPEICDVTSTGKVHPYKIGDCYIVVAVSASGNFMDVYSEPFKFSIEAAVTQSPVEVTKPDQIKVVAPAITAVKPTTKLIGIVYFGRNTSALDHKAYVALSKVLASLKSFKNYSIKLVGHSDGSKGLNSYAISSARSKTVAGFLKKNKTSGKIVIKGLGAKELIANVRANDGLNRRVEVWVTTANT